MQRRWWTDRRDAAQWRGDTGTADGGCAAAQGGRNAACEAEDGGRQGAEVDAAA
ncbi:hypothetical protein Scep_028712 [Stephania cephalantha]|uniref:Uncharacterized protein n=1 Tax=Stephania cephalantha TaxID=152367 RepID=A0AAP0ECI7_9MAGN